MAKQHKKPKQKSPIRDILHHGTKRAVVLDSTKQPNTQENVTKTTPQNSVTEPNIEKIPQPNSVSTKQVQTHDSLEQKDVSKSTIEPTKQIPEKEQKLPDSLDDNTIQGLLLKASYVTEDDLKSAQKQGLAYHTGAIEQLLSSGIITKDILGQAIAEHFNVPYSDLNSRVPSKEQVLKIPEKVAKKYGVVLFEEKEENITITSLNPSQKDITNVVGALFRDKKINITYSLPEDIENVFIHYRQSLAIRFESIIKAQKRVAPEIVEEILADASAYRSSDIHFEPQKDEVVIRFRVDGVLREAGRIQKQHYENILNRIKVQAKLRIDEHDATQDGAIRVENGAKTYDVRVSIAPTTEGEKVVMRLLSQYVRTFTMGDLGLSSTNQDMLTRASKKPFGMILVTGPTGSGKSTSLYAVLKTLNRPEVNITTIEDPVEYRLIGVNQIQVNEAKKITFAKGLRSIVRQDPDIILVGEIRDTETAEIAVNAALTGHLLLSTFHSNDAATTIPRLLDMEIEPFLMASTLELIIAQRLVRKICDHCKHSITVTREEIANISADAAPYFQDQNRLYKGKGCATCSDSGFTGRTAIFEFIELTSQMKDLVLKHPAAREIWKLARSQGARTLFEDGVEKVKAGVTTVDELLRIASPPEPEDMLKKETLHNANHDNPKNINQDSKSAKAPDKELSSQDNKQEQNSAKE